VIIGSAPATPDRFHTRRQRVALVMSALGIFAYAVISIIFINRLITAFTWNHVRDLLLMLLCLAINIAALVWLRRGRATLSASVFLLANTVVLVIFAITSVSTNALLGLVVALGLGAYASAALPRRAVAMGTLFAWASGALIATLDYVQPWNHGRLNLNFADPPQLVMMGMALVFAFLLARLYRGVPLNAKLLVAGGGLALLGAVMIFGPAYAIIQHLPPELTNLGAQLEGTLVVAAAVFVVAGALLSQVVARAILEPLQTVAGAATKVAEGDLNALHQPTPRGPSYDVELHVLEQNSQDEISDLVGAFNGMTGRLQQLTAGLEQNVAELGEAKQLVQTQYQQLQAQTEELQQQYQYLHAQTLELSERGLALSQAESDLRRLNAELEQRVANRTADLNQANAELARAVRAKDEFLAAMSHDLRSPLNSILLSASALEEGVYGAVTAPQLASIHGVTEGGQHLLALINDILDVARIGAGKVELAPAPLAVAEACQGAVRLVQESAQRKGLSVHVELDPQVTTLVADERRFKQILVNLLTNAVKFTPAGGHVGLTVQGEPEAERVRLTVWDTGVGIALADLEKLFRPFVQLPNPLSGDHTGTGLGLSLVRGMVELHGGSVAVESVVQQGSRFIVSLPWTPAAQPAARGAVPGTAPLSAAALLGQNQLILLAEDSELVLPSLTALLQSSGYRVLVARDGLEAIEAAAMHPVDLVLMDIQMPRLNGLEAIRHLRTRPATVAVPIIALTALAMPGDRELCLQAGADDYLSKPVNLRTLLAKVSEHLARGGKSRSA
jgi:signal transduction histidine kinase/ActR/RegA family two-component response regulator